MKWDVNTYCVTIYSEETIRKHDEKWIRENVDWKYEFESKVFDDDFILEYKDIITDWKSCCRHQKLKINTIKKLVKYVDWHEIATRQKLTDRFIDKYHKYMGWNDICTGQNLSEALIEKYADKVDWSEISFKTYLTIPFIRKFKDKINWTNFCQSYRTCYNDPDFFREFADYIDWEEVYEFVWEIIKKNIKLIREFRDYLPWYEVEEDKVFTKDQIREFWDRLTFIYEEDYHDKKIVKEFEEKVIRLE